MTDKIYNDDNFELDPAFIEKCVLVCAEIVMGSSIHDGCEIVGISPRCFYKYITKSPELEQNYARAREARADVRFDNADQLMKKIEDGTIRPEVGRVLLDGIKWMTGKEKPKKYGDNQQVNHSGTIQHEQLIIQRTPRTIDNETPIKALPVIDIDNVQK